MIKAKIAGLGLFGVIELAVAMPFAGHAGLIAARFEQSGNGNFALPHMDLFASVGRWFACCRDPVVNTGAIGTAASQ